MNGYKTSINEWRESGAAAYGGVRVFIEGRFLSSIYLNGGLLFGQFLQG